MLQHSVALKVHESFYSDENARYAFYQAANYLSQLSHPNIVSFRDYGFQRTVPPVGRKYEGVQVAYIVMEFIDGQSLADKVIRLSDGRDKVLTALRYFPQILSAMKYAHNCKFVDLDGAEKRGIFHGDIKPANILINRGEMVKVTDFMVPDVQRVLTRVGFSQFPGVRDKIPATAAFGTPGYMPYEQKYGGIVTAQTDVFSLGVTLYETLTDQLPYEDIGPSVGDTVKRPISLNPHIPRWLSDLTIGAIHLDPKRRISSVAEFEAEFLQNTSAENVVLVQPQDLSSRKTAIYYPQVRFVP